MVEIKDINGVAHSLPTNGKVNAALTTGIIGTTLGALGALGGLGALTTGDGNSNGILNSNGNGCKVSLEKYYTDRIEDIKSANATTMALQLQLCDLSARVMGNEVANTYQNRITDIGFANVDTRFGTERLITDYEIAAKTCKMLTGDLFLSPNKLGDSYVAPSRILDSYVPRDYLPGKGFYGGQCGASYGGYDNHCGPCDGYRGF